MINSLCKGKSKGFEFCSLTQKICLHLDWPLVGHLIHTNPKYIISHPHNSLLKVAYSFLSKQFLALIKFVGVALRI